MEKMIKIAPSILSANFTDIRKAVEDIKTADMIHCDVMDGVFVPNISFGPKMVTDIRKITTVPLDVHLMIVKPLKYIPQFIDAGADLITFHFEADVDISAALSLIKNSGVKCGIAISPDTPVESIKPYIAECDLLLLMSVYPGFSGQKFIPASIDKLRQLMALKDRLNPSMLIEMDGGITEENIAALHKEGVDMAVAGNAVFKENPPLMIEKLKKAAKI